ncbi:alpha- and gamma-adaptin-binding protein p34 [Microplitis demolitor]|uniref:alpha- and gamma-adaptin-binding protein p34 n=1 Tax=Microplitis demolitor TaxID=69319 RepID=UPI0004CD39B2|nr:alpha- and gamma-adaptin-binding protein p34 [Microplitis demolitor]
MDLPRVLILSTENNKASEIAKDLDSQLLGDDDDVKYFSWDIDNKYYSARVVLCATERLPLRIPVDGIEAVILHYEPKGDEPLVLEKYVPLIQSLNEADIFLLACETFPDAQKKDEVTEWCHVNKFELVEMTNPESTPDVMDDDFEQEKFGIERLIEVLHTHTWPNRILKGIPNGRISTSNEPDVNEIKEQLDNIQLNASRNGTDNLLMNSVLDGIMGEENTDFGELFGQLMAMKEHAATLSPSNRRAAAEQLVTAFWKAMGGDASEIEDLDE